MMVSFGALQMSNTPDEIAEAAGGVDGDPNRLGVSRARVANCRQRGADLGGEVARGGGDGLGVADADARRCARRGCLLAVVEHGALGKQRLGHIAGGRELHVAGGLNWNEQSVGSAMTLTMAWLWRAVERGIGGARQCLEEREVGERGEEAAAEDDGFAADAVGDTREG